MPRREQPSLGAYARIVSVGFVIAVLVVGGGMVVQPSKMTGWRTSIITDTDALRTPYQQAASQYVREHTQPGDAVIVALPNQVNLYLGSPIDYWLQTQMQLQATLDDHRSIPLHRLFGQDMLPDLEQLRDVFNRHRRVWYITSPGLPVLSTSSEAASQMIREQMEVVYEDYRTLVFLFGRNHLPAALQTKSEASLEDAATSPLP